MKTRPLALLIWLVIGVLAVAQATDRKPKIVIIRGDDIGQSNVSAYSHCMMGCKTPVQRVSAA